MQGCVAEKVITISRNGDIVDGWHETSLRNALQLDLERWHALMFKRCNYSRFKCVSPSLGEAIKKILELDCSW